MLQRVVTGLVLAGALFCALFYGTPMVVVILFLTVAVLCAREFGAMFLVTVRDRASVVVTCSLGYLAGALLPAPVNFTVVFLVASAAAFHFIVHDAGLADRARSSAFSFLAVVYVGGGLSFYPMTFLTPNGNHWIIAGLLCVSAGDTAAYLVGSAFGKMRLAPLVSPKKSVEGAVAGLLAGVGVGTLYATLFLPHVAPWFVGAGLLAINIVAQAGDLYESLLKRAAGVKDSGTLLPGHGGMFDRLDATIAAGPVVYLLAIFATRFGRG